MTTIEARVIKIEEGKHYGNLEITENDILEINGRTEIITESHYEAKRLVRFRTVRKNDGGGILELGYCVNRETGEIKQLFSGIYYGEDTGPFSKSDRYFELNDFLQRLER